jgi:hypothetical protein
MQVLVYLVLQAVDVGAPACLRGWLALVLGVPVWQLRGVLQQWQWGVKRYYPSQNPS